MTSTANRRVAMLLFKDVVHDTRVLKEARTLAENGFYVDIYCLKEMESFPVEIQGVAYHRLVLRTKRMKRAVTGGNSQGKDASLLLKMARSPFVKLAKDAYASREFARSVADALGQTVPDVIHAHDLPMLPIASRLANRLGIPLVYDAHELFSEMNGRKALERTISRLTEARYIGMASRVITVNHLLAAELKSRYGIHEPIVIRNCPELSLHAADRDYFHSKFKLPPNSRILVYQGGFTPGRGLEELVSAMVHVNGSVVLVFIGFGPSEKSLKQQALDLGLERRIFFHEAVPPDRLGELMKAADAGIVPYRSTCLNNYLATPNKLYDYVSAGIPVISGNGLGVTSFLEEYQVGISCDPNDPTSIAERVNELFGDSSRFEIYKRNCLEIRERFSWQVEEKELLRAYEGL